MLIITHICLVMHDSLALSFSLIICTFFISPLVSSALYSVHVCQVLMWHVRPEKEASSHLTNLYVASAVVVVSA